MCILNFIGSNVEAIIALSALGLATWQGVAQRNHNVLSVKPHLTLASHVSNISPQIQLELRNTGTGPAVIKEFKIYLDGNLVNLTDSIWQEIGEQLSISGIWGGGQWFANGDSIEVGAKEILFEVKTIMDGKDPKHDGNFVRNALDRVQVIIKYESVYGKKFTAKLKRT